MKSPNSSIQFSSFAKEYDWTKEYLIIHCISYKMFKRFLPFYGVFFFQECDPMLLKPMVDTFWNLTFDEQVGREWSFE